MSETTAPPQPAPAVAKQRAAEPHELCEHAARQLWQAANVFMSLSARGINGEGQELGKAAEEYRDTSARLWLLARRLCPSQVLVNWSKGHAEALKYCHESKPEVIA